MAASEARAELTAEPSIEVSEQPNRAARASRETQLAACPSTGWHESLAVRANDLEKKTQRLSDYKLQVVVEYYWQVFVACPAKVSLSYTCGLWPRQQNTESAVRRIFAIFPFSRARQPRPLAHRFSAQTSTSTK